MRHYIRGVVQGVGFRPFVYRIATELGCRGFVRNNGSNVEVCIDRHDDRFLHRLRTELPPLARIDSIDSIAFEEADACGEDAFVIKFSKSGERNSPIPVDTALCGPCRAEMRDRADRRYHYAFTNCTDCGARFSVIADIPYDRPKTSLAPFEMCDECRAEYTDPLNRRFHAQTTACPLCGPHYTLYDRTGAVRQTGIGATTGSDPIDAFAAAIDDGAIGVVKAWGGMHIVARLDRIPTLRERYRRPAKPFAVMVRDLDTARRYADPGPLATELLTSPQAPITLVPKAGGATAQLQDLAAPALDRIGLYLPHTGVQLRLFDTLETDALVMTSANLPGEPMTTANDDAFALEADCYLLHNRGIVNRIDDSVVLPYRANRYFLRKSRGFVPDPMPIAHNGRVICVGPERNVVSSFARDGQLTLSQYIGNTTHYDVLRFLEDATRHLAHLFGVGLDELDAVGYDLHPRYASRRVARTLADEAGVDAVPIQHHYAHAAAMMLEKERYDPLVCLSLDGTGWGTDGTVWGGEVLALARDERTRVASLAPFPLLGGDAAIRDPNRLVYALATLARPERDPGIGANSIDPTLARILDRQLETGAAVKTSSLGRVLDAVSSALGIGCVRTYDGEPAIRLERYLAHGRRLIENGDLNLRFEPRWCNGNSTSADTPRLDVVDLFGQLVDEIDAHGSGGDGDGGGSALTERQRAALATACVEPLITELATAAVRFAHDEGIGAVALSGGVSYNIPINEWVREVVLDCDPPLDLLLHDRLPNGDGGISAGQNVLVGWKLDL